MVSTRKVHEPDRPSFEAWLNSLSLSDTTKEKLKAVSHMPDRLLVGQEMVEILHQLNMDDATLQAALVYPYCEKHNLTDTDVLAEFGGQGFGTFKPALADLAVSNLGPINAEMKRLMEDHTHLDSILARGAERAHAISQPIMADIRRLVGFLGASRG